uniref:Uncharacterized protein n=1 Tax=Rhizophora mucronata TaxID=61149 RepID=A0A2P2QZ91_RHIMU
MFWLCKNPVKFLSSCLFIFSLYSFFS